jgi:signal transduction histidine kinase
MTSVLRRIRGFLGSRKRPAVPAQTVFRDFTESLNLIEDFDLIARNMLGTIKEAVAWDRLVLFIYDGDLRLFRVGAASGYDADHLKNLTLSGQDKLVKWLKVNRAHLDIGRQAGVFGYLEEKDKEVIARLDLAFCFPILSMNRLIGILCIGSVTSDNGFSGQEVSFIEAVMPQAGIALENALLYKEQRERVRRMLRADRLATIGELAAGAAHEIRNPLTSIKSSLQYLETRCREETERKLLGVALRETDRIDEILVALLSFSRPSMITKEACDIAALLEESVALISIQARTRQVDIRTLFPPSPVIVAADKSQIKQLFLNVFLNAVQAMETGGTLSVEITRLGEGRIRVRVSDTGPGISEVDLEKIFDPFFTTKKGGTGLGLSICYTIVKAHGGEIEFISRPGEGTTALITLPSPSGRKP